MADDTHKALNFPRGLNFDDEPATEETEPISRGFGRSASTPSCSSTSSPIAAVRPKVNPLSARKLGSKKPPGLNFKSPASPCKTEDLTDQLEKRGGIGFISVDGVRHECCEQHLEDLKEDLGRGAYGFVRKMRHKATRLDMAVKQIRDNSSDALARQQLLNDLDIIRSCSSHYIVRYYGFDFSEGEIWIFMELMRCSLEQLYLEVRSVSERQGRVPLVFPEPALARITVCCLDALHYLKTEHKIMHRDVKPSNILFGFDGSVKLCDFGISNKMGLLSLVKTAVGCERYLPPERLNPSTSRNAYDTRSDVWALGITIAEVALMEYPYREKGYGLLQAIVDSTPPRLPEDAFSAECCEFVRVCLQKNIEDRPKYNKPPEACPHVPCLLEQPFVKKSREAAFDLAGWYNSLKSS